MVVTVFEDDKETVPDEVIAYRRVAWPAIGGREGCAPGETGTLNSNCFKDYPIDRALAAGFSEPCMSIGLSNILEALGYTPEKMLEGHEGMGLAEITASDLRKLT